MSGLNINLLLSGLINKPQLRKTLDDWYKEVLGKDSATLEKIIQTSLLI